MSSEQAGADGNDDQTVRWLRTRNAELENSNQLLLGELAERSRLEAPLREMAAGFHWLMRSNVLGIVFIRTDGTITEANDTFLRTLGYSREDLSESEICWHHICHSEEAIRKCLEEGVYTLAQLQFVRKNGARVKLLFAAERLTGRQQIVGFTYVLAS